MTRTGSIAVTLLLVVMLAAGASAQTPAPPPAAPAAAVRPLDRSDLRHQIYVMEGALARAVQYGAQVLNREIRSIVPEMMALSGEPQARGVYLEGYGVFFDVGVPILHQSMIWSLRTMLTQDSRGLAEALNVLKQSAKEAGARRADLENAIQRVERQIGPLADPSSFGFSTGQPGLPQVINLPKPQAAAPQMSAQGATPEAVQRDPPPPTFFLDKKYLQDPNAINRAYTDSVQNQLIDAMIDYSLPMAIGPDEFLTVAARDNMQRDSLAPPDPYEEVVTILLRIKGSDLAAYRAAQIDRHEVRKRVQVREF